MQDFGWEVGDGGWGVGGGGWECGVEGEVWKVWGIGCGV